MLASGVVAKIAADAVGGRGRKPCWLESTTAVGLRGEKFAPKEGYAQTAASHKVKKINYTARSPKQPKNASLSRLSKTQKKNELPKIIKAYLAPLLIVHFFVKKYFVLGHPSRAAHIVPKRFPDEVSNILLEKNLIKTLWRTEKKIGPPMRGRNIQTSQIAHQVPATAPMT